MKDSCEAAESKTARGRSTPRTLRTRRRHCNNLHIEPHNSSWLLHSPSHEYPHLSCIGFALITINFVPSTICSNVYIHVSAAAIFTTRKAQSRIRRRELSRPARHINSTLSPNSGRHMLLLPIFSGYNDDQQTSHPEYALIARRSRFSLCVLLKSFQW
jgi:hypothetical protein